MGREGSRFLYYMYMYGDFLSRHFQDRQSTTTIHVMRQHTFNFPNLPKEYPNAQGTVIRTAVWNQSKRLMMR